MRARLLLMTNRKSHTRFRLVPNFDWWKGWTGEKREGREGKGREREV